MSDSNVLYLQYWRLGSSEVRSSQPAEALEGGGSLIPALQQGWTAG